MATEWLYGDGTPMIGQPLQFASPPSSQYSQYQQNQTQTFSTRSPTKMAMAPQEFVDVRHTVMQPRTIVEPEHFEITEEPYVVETEAVFRPQHVIMAPESIVKTRTIEVKPQQIIIRPKTIIEPQEVVVKNRQVDHQIEYVVHPQEVVIEDESVQMLAKPVVFAQNMAASQQRGIQTIAYSNVMPIQEVATPPRTGMVLQQTSHTPMQQFHHHVVAVDRSSSGHMPNSGMNYTSSPGYNKPYQTDYLNYASLYGLPGGYEGVTDRV